MRMRITINKPGHYNILSVIEHINFFKQVAMRALGFEVKKADVLKIMKDYDRESTGKITFDDFNEVSKYNQCFYRLIIHQQSSPKIIQVEVGMHDQMFILGVWTKWPCSYVTVHLGVQRAPKNFSWAAVLQILVFFFIFKDGVFFQWKLPVL